MCALRVPLVAFSATSGTCGIQWAVAHQTPLATLSSSAERRRAALHSAGRSPAARAAPELSSMATLGAFMKKPGVGSASWADEEGDDSMPGACLAPLPSLRRREARTLVTQASLLLADGAFVPRSLCARAQRRRMRSLRCGCGLGLQRRLPQRRSHLRRSVPRARRRTLGTRWQPRCGGSSRLRRRADADDAQVRRALHEALHDVVHRHVGWRRSQHWRARAARSGCAADGGADERKQSARLARARRALPQRQRASLRAQPPPPRGFITSRVPPCWSGRP